MVHHFLFLFVKIHTGTNVHVLEGWIKYLIFSQFVPKTATTLSRQHSNFWCSTPKNDIKLILKIISAETKCVLMWFEGIVFKMNS